MNATQTNTAQRISLSNQDAAELTQYLVQLSASSLPLAGGLRAAAAETRNRRVAAALVTFADGIEHGQSLDQIVSSSSILPSHFAGLVAAAVRSGRLAEALADLLEHQREMQELRQSIWRGFAYPLVVSAMTSLVMLFVLFGITPVFENMFDEFALQTPWFTEMLFWFRDVGIWLLAGLLLIVICGVMFARSRMRTAAASRMMAATPLLGSVWHWLSVAEWSSLLSILIRHGVPVPEALRVGGAGLANEYMKQISLSLADGAEQGQPLSRLMTHHAFPQAMTPLIAWGESKNMLSDAFEDVRIWLARRVQLRSAMLQAIIPPILFIAIGCCVMFVLGGLLIPLISLIQGLS